MARGTLLAFALGTTLCGMIGSFEALVVMRRMPDSRRLSTLLSQGFDVEPALRLVARQLAIHHASARRSAAVTVRRLLLDARYEVLPTATIEEVVKETVL